MSISSPVARERRYALASRTVFYGMAVAMAIAIVVSLIGMPGGKVETGVEDFGEPTSDARGSPALPAPTKEPPSG